MKRLIVLLSILILPLFALSQTIEGGGGVANISAGADPNNIVVLATQTWALGEATLAYDANNGVLWKYDNTRTGGDKWVIIDTGLPLWETVGDSLMPIDLTKGIAVDGLSRIDKLKVTDIYFDTAAAHGTHQTGTMAWDIANETATIDMPQTDVRLQLGQEMYVRVINQTGVLITNGSVVFINGSSGGRSSIELAKADLPTTSGRVIGIVTHDIGIAGTGLCTVFGSVGDLNTLAYTAGDPLYLSASTAGEFTNVKPEYPNYAIQLGSVLVSDVSAGTILANVIGQPRDIQQNAWNGDFLEPFDFRVSSNGTTITGNLKRSDVSDYLTMNFSDGYTLLDVSGAGLDLILNPGTSSIPQSNFVYIPVSTKVLTVSGSSFPTEEHIKIACIILLDATTTQIVGGALGNQNSNDPIAGDNQQGHILHITERIRQFPAHHDSGAAGLFTINTTPSPDSATFSSASGKIWQMHLQDWTAKDMLTIGDTLFVVNDFTQNYKMIGNIYDALTDANNVSMSGKSFSYVFWGIANKSGESSFLMMNLPTGSYNSAQDAIDDAQKHSVYSIPDQFIARSFLIGRATVTHAVGGGGTLVLDEFQDLRKFLPNNIAGGTSGGGGVTEFAQLTDVPSSYLTHANKIVYVNVAETGLEYRAESTISTDNITEGVTNKFNVTHTSDVTGSEALTIANDAVTFPKMQNVLTNRLLGSGDAGTEIVEIILGSNLSFTGTTLNAASGGAGEANTSSNGGVAGIGIVLPKAAVDLPFKSMYAASNKISILDGGGNNRVVFDIAEANLSITTSQIPDFDAGVAATPSVTLNTAKVTNANHTNDVTGSTALTIAADAVTFPKMQNITSSKLLGSSDAGTEVQEIILGTNLSISGSTLNATGGTSEVTDAMHDFKFTSIKEIKNDGTHKGLLSGLFISETSDKWVHWWRSGDDHGADVSSVLKARDSYDRGKTWVNERTFHTEAAIDVRNGAYGVMGSNRFGMVMSRYTGAWTNPVFIYSDDEGATWSSTVLTTITACVPYFDILKYPASAGGHDTNGFICYPNSSDDSQIYSLKTIDNGANWTLATALNAAALGNQECGETTVARLGTDDKWVMILRNMGVGGGVDGLNSRVSKSTDMTTWNTTVLSGEEQGRNPGYLYYRDGRIHYYAASRYDAIADLVIGGNENRNTYMYQHIDTSTIWNDLTAWTGWKKAWTNASANDGKLLLGYLTIREDNLGKAYATFTGNEDQVNKDVSQLYLASTEPAHIAQTDINITTQRLIQTLEAGTGGVTAGDYCQMNSSGQMVPADASAEATAKGEMRIAMEDLLVGVSGNFMTKGEYTTTGLTKGSEYWLSLVTGDITSTKPIATGEIVRYMGQAKETTILIFNPSQTYIEIP